MDMLTRHEAPSLEAGEPTPAVETDTSPCHRPVSPTDIQVPKNIGSSARMFRDACMTASSIPERDLSAESMLMTLKWFDYRFITPAAATRRFISSFKRIVGDTHKGRNEERDCSVPSIWELPHHLLLHFWHGRQYADALGMKYNHFIRYVLTYANAQEGGVAQQTSNDNLPMLITEPALRYAEGQWRKQVRGSILERSKLPQYRIQGGIIWPGAQMDHVLWLLQRLEERTHHERRGDLATLIYCERTLSENHAVHAFGVGEVVGAKLRAEELGLEPLSCTTELLRPGCFSLPGATSPGCTTCEVEDRCRSEAALVTTTNSQIENFSDCSDEELVSLNSFIERKYFESEIERMALFEEHFGISF